VKGPGRPVGGTGWVGVRRPAWRVALLAALARGKTVLPSQLLGERPSAALFWWMILRTAGEAAD
jgi:hypothetical protein